MNRNFEGAGAGRRVGAGGGFGADEVLLPPAAGVVAACEHEDMSDDSPARIGRDNGVPKKKNRAGRRLLIMASPRTAQRLATAVPPSQSMPKAQAVNI